MPQSTSAKDKKGNSSTKKKDKESTSRERSKAKSKKSDRSRSASSDSSDSSVAPKKATKKSKDNGSKKQDAKTMTRGRTKDGKRSHQRSTSEESSDSSVAPKSKSKKHKEDSSVSSSRSRDKIKAKKLKKKRESRSSSSDSLSDSLEEEAKKKKKKLIKKSSYNERESKKSIKKSHKKQVKSRDSSSDESESESSVERPKKKKSKVRDPSSSSSNESDDMEPVKKKLKKATKEGDKKSEKKSSSRERSNTRSNKKEKRRSSSSSSSESPVRKPSKTATKKVANAPEIKKKEVEMEISSRGRLKARKVYTETVSSPSSSNESDVEDEKPKKKKVIEPRIRVARESTPRGTRAKITNYAETVTSSSSESGESEKEVEEEEESDNAETNKKAKLEAKDIENNEKKSSSREISKQPVSDHQITHESSLPTVPTSLTVETVGPTNINTTKEPEEEEEEELRLTTPIVPIRGRPRKYPKNEDEEYKVVKAKRELIPSKRFSPPSSSVAHNKPTRSLPSSSNSSVVTGSPSPIHNNQFPSTSRQGVNHINVPKVPQGTYLQGYPPSRPSHATPKPRTLEGMSVEEATPILEAWFAEIPMYIERTGRSKLALQIGWSKYRIKKWFREHREMYGLRVGPPPQLTQTFPDDIRASLHTIFAKRQFIDKKQAEDLGAQIGLSGPEVYSWMFEHRLIVFHNYMYGLIEDLPSQMKVLEEAYEIRNVIDPQDADRILAQSNATIEQACGYFRSRRFVDKMAGILVPHESEIVKLHREIKGIDFMFPDLHWEYSVCSRYIDQFSSADEFRDGLDANLLAQRRSEARGHMFHSVALPYSHSSDFENWTTTDIQEFASQVVTYRARNRLREVGIEGVHLKSFNRGNVSFYDKLVASDFEQNIPPAITWEEFTRVGDCIKQIQVATNSWMKTFNFE